MLFWLKFLSCYSIRRGDYVLRYFDKHGQNEVSTCSEANIFLLDILFVSSTKWAPWMKQEVAILSVIGLHCEEEPVSYSHSSDVLQAWRLTSLSMRGRARVFFPGKFPDRLYEPPPLPGPWGNPFLGIKLSHSCPSDYEVKHAWSSISTPAHHHGMY
jgi:hypothetical protein